MASTEASAVIFGLRLTAAEWQLAVEGLKAALLTSGGAVSILLFNNLAKKREQDGALFNEIIKRRIDLLHVTNKSIVDLAGKLLETLDPIVANAAQSPRLKDTQRLEQDRDCIAKLYRFNDALPERINRLKTTLALNRYEIGEHGHRSAMQRVSYLSKRIDFILLYYLDKCYKKWLPSMEEATFDTAELPPDSLKLHVAEIVLDVFAKEIRGILCEVHDDFENVIRRKGRSIIYHVPVDVDRIAGMLRLNPITEEVRHRLAIFQGQLRERSHRKSLSTIAR